MTGRSPVLDDRAVEQLLIGRPCPNEAELQHAVGLLRSIGSASAPPPTAALARLLDTGFEPEAVPLRRPVRRSWTARGAAALTAAAASLLVAGTAQALPAPLQDGLADLVSALTPFELPRSGLLEGSPPPTPDDATPSPTPSDVPSPSVPAGRTPTDEREPEPSTGRATGEQRSAQEAGEGAADASEDAADAADDAAEDAADAARERKEAAADTAREREEAAADTAREREQAAADAAREREEARDAARESEDPAEVPAERVRNGGEDAGIDG